jgi:hypothetical protein
VASLAVAVTVTCPLLGALTLTPEMVGAVVSEVPPPLPPPPQADNKRAKMVIVGSCLECMLIWWMNFKMANYHSKASFLALMLVNLIRIWHYRAARAGWFQRVPTMDAYAV